MLDSTELMLPGMNALLTRSETEALSADLSAIRQQFARSYLPPNCFRAELAKLGISAAESGRRLERH